ncbi:MAG: peptidase T [Rikenellaceae bacterium]
MATHRPFGAALRERFLRYVTVDTQSSTKSDSFPSTDKQLVLLGQLKVELEQMGLSDVVLDKFGYLMATIPATVGYESKRVIGFLAHVDTSPDASGTDVRPSVVSGYDGGDIELSGGDRITPTQYPALAKLLGHDLATSDGKTLLGADDKAGVAIIMTMAAELTQNREIEHGKIRICFTPDEEIGKGVDFFDPRIFGADYAYTLDGGAEGEIEYENFNAAGATIEIKGHNHHPGAAKGKMINALDVAHELHAMLPSSQRPQYTDGYEGFCHLVEMSGSVQHATMEYIIRDHSMKEFERRKVELWSAVDFLGKRYGDGVMKLAIKDQYFNMRKMVAPHPELIELAKEAMLAEGVEPIVQPIRGGTDGARLSYMGLPCPNLFTGGGNFHSTHEYCSLTTMERAVSVVVRLIELWGKQ